MQTAPENHASFESLLDRLVESLRWRGSVFHAGRYCGPWRASTAGKGLASFHWVLQGSCYLHRPGQPSLSLHAGEGVCLLRDEAHSLTPHADAAAPVTACDMLPAGVEAMNEPSCTLACGFLHFDGALAPVLVAALPGCIVMRQGQAEACGPLLQLMLAEARTLRSPEEPSAVMQRLADLLFMVCLRAHLRQSLSEPGAARGLWSLAVAPAMAPLLLALLETPGDDWTAERMAARVHMSRARFFRAFTQACGLPPAQFLLELRMQLAAQRLQQGDTIARTAEQVGYQSHAAFSRAFRKVTGAQPGLFRREQQRTAH